LTDIYSKRKRSQIMSKISGHETKPEILIRKYLFSLGFRFRKNVKSLPGKPDIVLPKYKTVIFVHGCFWHGHMECKASTLPTTNVRFWKDKIKGNIDRDLRNKKKLKKLGWKVIIIWQCKLKNLIIREKTLAKLAGQIKSK
jgi:DNA mismatch endonuclease (patch repair protein)